jgi:hypothetical protein
LLGLLQHISDIEALLLGCITGEHVKKVEGDAVLEGLHTLSMLLGVLVPLKIGPRSCSNLTGDNLVPAKSGIFAEKVRIEQEEPFSGRSLGLFSPLLSFFSRRASLRAALSCDDWLGLSAPFFCIRNGPSETLGLFVQPRFRL